MTILANKEKLYSYLKFLKIALFILIFSILSWLAYNNFAPLGKLVLEYNFNKQVAPFLSLEKGLDNPEKNIGSNVGYSRVTSSPAEFSLQMPRKFKSVEVEIKYLSSYPVLTISSKKNKSQNYITKILELGLSGETWKRITDQEKGLVLFQQYKSLTQKSNTNAETENTEIASNEVSSKPFFDYNRVKYFLNDLDNIVERKEKKIAYFNYDLSDKAKIPAYSPSEEKTVFEKTIRGKHKIITYLGENEILDYDFYYQDMNKKDGPDRFNVFIDKGNETIARYTENDDGDETSSEKPSSIKNIHVLRDDLEPGKYVITLDISDDLYVNKIETGQKYLAFQDHLFLENSKQNLDFYTDAENLSLSTLYNDGLDQDILSERQISYDQLELENSKSAKKENSQSLLDLNGNNLDNKVSINKINSIYTLLTPGIANKVSIPKDDLVINYKGLIGTDPEIVYNLSKLEEFVYPLQNGFDYNDADYVITDYFTEPKTEGPYKISKQKFNLDELEVDENNKVNFSINILGYNRNNSDLKIAGVKFTLEKEPWNLSFLINKIKSHLKNERF